MTNRAAILAIAVGLGGCHGAPTATPQAAPPNDAAVAPDAAELGLGSAGGDPDEAPEDERIAAVERAMNDLAPVANQCWAVAATDDFRLAGELRMLVTVSEGGARIEVGRDQPGDPVLTACMTRVLEAYPWASPLRGQAIELPFRFTAPAMQNVIDRRMVAHHGQAGLDVAVLVDLKNTGAAAVALLDVRAAAGRGIGPRQPDRAELWRLTTSAELVQGKVRTALAAGDLVLVPAGATLELGAGAAPLAATVALVPGGAMGVARAGALPQALIAAAGAAPPAVTVVRAAQARRYVKGASAATLLLERGPLAAVVVELDAGATMPLHVHAKETEVVYLEAGVGTFTVGGVAVPVTDTMVLTIPPGVEHGYVATTATRAYQIYTPPGPEQRWKKSP